MSFGQVFLELPTSADTFQASIVLGRRLCSPPVVSITSWPTGTACPSVGRELMRLGEERGLAVESVEDAARC
jgi:hypothetical protein